MTRTMATGSSHRATSGGADWDFNSGDGTLTETSVYAARMLVGTEFMRVVTSIRYKSAHDPDDGDGVLPSGDFRGGDYRSKFYAEFILDADASDPPDCPFLAVAITPAELLLVEYDGGETRELARTDFVSEEDVWHTLSAVTADGRAIVSCVPDTAGAAAARLDADFSVGAAAGGVDGAVGVGVGANAAYTFEALGSRADLGEYTAHYRWEYDALGRKSAEMRAPYGGAKTWAIFALRRASPVAGLRRRLAGAARHRPNRAVFVRPRRPRRPRGHDARMRRDARAEPGRRDLLRALPTRRIPSSRWSGPTAPSPSATPTPPSARLRFTTATATRSAPAP